MGLIPFGEEEQEDKNESDTICVGKEVSCQVVQISVLFCRGCSTPPHSPRGLSRGAIRSLNDCHVHTERLRLALVGSETNQ